METLIKRVTLIGLITTSLVCADNTGVVVPSSNGKPITQEQRIANNFKKIDKLFISINKKIKQIETLRKGIEIMHQNKESEVLCAVIDSLDRDIDSLTIQMENVKDEEKRDEIKGRLNTRKSIRDDERAKLNHQCLL